MCIICAYYMYIILIKPSMISAGGGQADDIIKVIQIGKVLQSLSLLLLLDNCI